jgi:hypothetical protein
MINSGITGAVVQNCYIDNQGGGGQGIAGQGSFIANNIVNCVDGIDVRGDNTLIQGNYIHSMAGPNGAHPDSIQADGGFSNLSIIDNTVVNELGNNASLMLDNYWGPISKVTIDHNQFLGGGYTVYLGEMAHQPAGGGGPMTNVTFTNNVVSKGGWGYLALSTQLGDVPVMSGNVDSATGALLPFNNQQPGTGTPAGAAAPTITSFSSDTGVVGDGITDHNTLTLTGTAAANSTVKVLDGTTQVGTATADSRGTWTLTTAKLADGSHSLTATDTVSGTTSAASAALAVKIDTVAPNAPVETNASIVSGTTKVQLTGTAEANSTLQVFDGTTQVGTATANSSGAWSLTTGTLASGGHSFTTKATDAAGNTGLASAALAVTIPSAPTAPAAPTIASFLTDSGVVGDHITNDNALTLAGTAAANSTVKVFDGSAQIGTTTANSSGSWSYITSVLTDAIHVLTATDTVSGVNSAASSPLSVTVDTAAPAAPVLVSDSVVNTNHVLLSGTAEANSTVTVYDGTTAVGTATAGANGAWSVTTSALATGAQALTAKATDVAGNTSALSQALDPVIGSPALAPAVPKIVSYSNDSGVAGDGITNDKTLTLAGTAVANSSVTIFDGANKLGTATVNSSGAWSYTTAALGDGKHSFTATDTSSGKTSAASSATAVTIDTNAPAAPVLVSDSVVNTNHVLLSGTAEANSTVAVYDGTTAIGTATAGANGAWSVTTGALAIGSHALTAKATDAAGNTSALSQALGPVIGSSVPPSAPKIISFSQDSGVAGDHITNDNTQTLTGTAAANSTVTVFDGANKLGTATVNGSGAWSYTTAALGDGNHSLTATDTASGHTSLASSALAVTIDTHGPATPTMAVYSQGGTAIGGTTTADDLLLKGTAEANSTVHVFDGGKQIGTATTNTSGLWSFDTGHVADGSHSFTSTATDAAGNASAASAAKGVSVDAPASAVGITNMYENSSHIVTIKGTADAYSQIKLYDGTKSVGMVHTGADGTWSFTPSSAISNTVHTFTAQELDSTSHVVATSGSAILGSSGSNTLTSTAGNNLFVGNGHPDTFVFASDFGKDVINDFRATGRGHDVVQFNKSVFDSFADVLAHATQSGQNVVIADGTGDSLTLKNVKLAALDKHDFHFA